MSHDRFLGRGTSIAPLVKQSRAVCLAARRIAWSLPKMYRQDESIYALIPPEEVVEQRPPMCAPPRRAPTKSQDPLTGVDQLLEHAENSKTK